MRRSEKAQHLIRTRIKDARTGESKVIIEENKIKNVIDNIPTGSFTVLDFMKTLRLTCPEDYETLVKRFGTFGMKRRYTVTRYLANRLDLYPRNPHSILVPFTRYKQGKFTDYRITTEEERKIFGSQWTAVYKKKPKKQRIDLRNHYRNWNSTYAKYAQQTRQKTREDINSCGFRTVDVDIATTRHNCLKKLITQHSQHNGQEQ